MGLNGHAQNECSPSHANGTARGTSEVPSRIAVRPSLGEFLRLLFRSLEQEQVRYCAIHGCEELPDQCASQHHLELALHPDDAGKLLPAVRFLSKRGYQLVQHLVHGVRANVLVFSWFENLTLKTVTVTFASEYRERGFIWNCGSAMVATRQKVMDFWVADPATEFTYLLLKMLSNSAVNACHEQSFRNVLQKLGRSRAETIAGQLLGEKQGRAVVQACLDQRLVGIPKPLKTTLVRRHFLRRPFQTVRCLLGNSSGMIKRWHQPTGLFLVLLGPDGVGKSTLVAGMISSLTPLFRHHNVFHWRPGVILPIEEGDAPSGSPHDEPPRSVLVSILFLFGFCLDYWLGYALRIRPLLARSGFVIFDRYYFDLLVDQKRYRYSGPMSLVRLLLRIIPGRKNLVLILDAPEDVVLSRKQQLTLDELRRQRMSYRSLIRALENSHIIETHHGIEQALAESCRIVTEHLAQRLEPHYASLGAVNLTQTSGGSI